MAVPKIAVIALVAIIAVPILLGYAMNLTETTVTDYKAAGDPVNVTPLLQNSSSSSFAHGDSYKLNTDFKISGSATMYPFYESISSTTSALPLRQETYTNMTWNNANVNLNYSYYYEQFDYNSASSNLHMTLYGNVGGVETYLNFFTYLHSIYYDKASLTYIISYYSSPTTIGYFTGTGELTKMTLNTASGVADNVFIARHSGILYVDISAGYHFIGKPSDWSISLPTHSRSFLLTMDLNSITDSSYSVIIKTAKSGYTLEKSTSGGVVSWLLRDLDDPTYTIDLYYDQTKNSNTYQIYWDLIQTKTDSTYKYYASHREFRYIGSWPSSIGEANVYQTFTHDKSYTTPAGDSNLNLDDVNFSQATNNRSPKLRMDDALFKAFNYSTIYNVTYNPRLYKLNPSTTINDPTMYGSDITFGGNTYTVSEGNITLGTHQIPVKGLTFTSVPNGSGTYDNKIGNTVVSTTAQPSTITFGGMWSMSVSTQTMEQYSYTKTEWHAGEFGWNGIDDNFLIVGLITCLGVFIALGIYARKSRSGGVIPLMVAVGCAAMIFFIML